jgi:hypothetical protein
MRFYSDMPVVLYYNLTPAQRAAIAALTQSSLACVHVPSGTAESLVVGYAAEYLTSNRGFTVNDKLAAVGNSLRQGPG